MKILISAALIFISSFAYGQTKELPDFTDLVEKQGPAVVNISTTQIMRNAGLPQMPNIPEDDPFLEFFRRFMPPGQMGPKEFESKSLGSGFIISSDGVILTNAHVVDAADEITVRLTDKREFRAKVIGADKRTDIAVIKIEATGLPKVVFADPAKLKVGEWVVAIGAPFGFENSVTAGIVSAKGRSLPQENYVPFIQTDVAINPGNSGGPLFNLRGEVVGINSQIYSRSGGFMGLSFAIPIDVAMDISNQLRATGKVTRGRIGVVIQEVTKELAESFGLSKPTGALVNSVMKGGAADKAGIEASDIILKFDGKPVTSSSDLSRVVSATKPGTKVIVQVWRKGVTKELTATVEEAPNERPGLRSSSKRGKAPQSTNRLGLTLNELTSEQKRELNLTYGVMVEDVTGSLRGDVQRGDIILSVVNKGINTDIRSAEQFNQLISQIDKGRNITLLIRRGDNQVFVTIKPNDLKSGEADR